MVKTPSPLDNPVVEPFGQGYRHARWLPVLFQAVPLFNPVKIDRRLSRSLGETDAGFDIGGRQPTEGVLQLPVLVATHPPPDAP